MKISAIISDYDGTLCPTSSLYSDNSIPQDLYNILFDISSCIPICIISSKDFNFIGSNVNFAKIISCIMGIETFIFLQKDKEESIDYNFRDNNEILDLIELKNKIRMNGLIKYHINQKENVSRNSSVLENLSSVISKNFNDIKIFKKYTYREKFLAGISIDYRHLLNWENFKFTIEPRILNKIQEFIKINSLSTNNLNIQSYLTHPFIDVYSTYYNKGDILTLIRSLLKLGDNKKILYLGDSENDNSAFKKADLSINIKSDERINTKLDSHYTLEFNELSSFLLKLHKEDFNFTSMSI
ncbi:MAG TPA: HAD hydrolase family protein [Nitrososphaeraceae archaeon]|nr:HAD hydrolase family protein [Nitrososphaeraceae archaeon]